MASNFVAHDEIERRFTNMTGYVDHSIDQIRITLIAEIRASEARTQERIEASEARTQAKLDAFRERHDVEMAQVHAEFGRIQEVLLWIAQRLPPEPIGPPPAQFLTFPDPERT